MLCPNQSKAYCIKMAFPGYYYRRPLVVRYGNPVLGLYEARLETVIDRNESHHLCPFLFLDTTKALATCSHNDLT